jgi:hypothetical protein
VNDFEVLFTERAHERTEPRPVGASFPVGMSEPGRPSHASDWGSPQMNSWIADSFISSNAVAAPIGSSSPSIKSSFVSPMRSIVI